MKLVNVQIGEYVYVGAARTHCSSYIYELQCFIYTFWIYVDSAMEVRQQWKFNDYILCGNVVDT